jgi:hypothetical protein
VNPEKKSLGGRATGHAKFGAAIAFAPDAGYVQAVFFPTANGTMYA